MRFKLYQGSNICTWRTYLKSRPSDAAREINITFTFSPYIFSLLVAYFKSSALSCEKYLSPVIIMYLACLKLSSLLGFSVFASIFTFTTSFWNSDLPLCLTNPISSSAKAIGTTPPSIYCVYTIIIPPCATVSTPSISTVLDADSLIF